MDEFLGELEQKDKPKEEVKKDTAASLFDNMLGFDEDDAAEAYLNKDKKMDDGMDSGNVKKVLTKKFRDTYEDMMELINRSE